MNQRQRVVAEAETWLRTPYHHMGRIKGGGTDCLMLLAEVYEAAGVIPHIDVPFYPPDWNLHRDAERYLQAYCQPGLDGLRAMAVPIPFPEDLPTRLDVINHVFHSWHEHRWAYDFDTLSHRLRAAGFTIIERADFGRSRLPALAQDRDQHRPYSLYVEAVKS